LVHLCPGCYTINSHEEQLFGFDFPEKMVYICKNGSENLFFRKSKMSILVVGMRTWSNEETVPARDKTRRLTIMYNSIEIQV